MTVKIEEVYDIIDKWWNSKKNLLDINILKNNIRKASLLEEVDPFLTMRLCCQPGQKVRYTGINGTDGDIKFADSYLKAGEIYTVDYLDIGGWHSTVNLKEVPYKSFNTVHFVEVDS